MHQVNSNQKNKKMKNIFVLALVIFCYSGLLAQDQTPKTDARQTAQRARIRQGKNSGEISKEERVKLKAQQRNIRRTERRAKADGIVTSDEQSTLDRKQNRANRGIRRAKHNKKKAE